MTSDASFLSNFGSTFGPSQYKHSTQIDAQLGEIDVLVIDDDSVVLESLKRLLQKRGYRVETAQDAGVGIQKAALLMPSVIICDWLLPGNISGLDICHHIKQDTQLSTTAFLMMTSHTDIANRIDALEAGADDLLFKPVDTAELIARVKSGMRLYQLTQELKAQTRRLESELTEAAAYVSSLLPKDTPAGMGSCVSITSRFISSQALGGDCFDHYWLDADSLVMYLLDVSGHGLGAALLSTSVLNVLRSQSLPNTNFYQPQTVLKALNEAFQMDDQSDKYFTIWYGVYNRTSRQLVYASAGHPPAILVTPKRLRKSKPTQSQDFTLEQLRTSGLPIGMMADSAYQWQCCHVELGSRLYIFSDGIYEISPAQSSVNGLIEPGPAFLGLSGLVEILNALASQNQLSLDNLIQQVGSFGGGNPFEDDLSLLEVRFQS